MTAWRRRLTDLVVYSETTPSRITMTIASLLWGLLLLWPGETFDAPRYEFMRAIAPERWWGAAFLIIGICLGWRALSPTERPILAFAVNMSAFCLFAGSAVALWLARPLPVPADDAAQLALALLSLWVLMRSGINSLPGWRGD